MAPIAGRGVVHVSDPSVSAARAPVLSGLAPGGSYDGAWPSRFADLGSVIAAQVRMLAAAERNQLRYRLADQFRSIASIR